MALFSQNMLELGIELAAHDPDYDDLAAKFADHFLLIAHSMNRTGPAGMWDEEDGFYYDVLRFPDGTATRLKVRSMVGLLPRLRNNGFRGLAAGTYTAPSGARGRALAAQET